MLLGAKVVVEVAVDVVAIFSNPQPNQCGDMF